MGSDIQGGKSGLRSGLEPCIQTYHRQSRHKIANVRHKLDAKLGLFRHKLDLNLGEMQAILKRFLETQVDKKIR